MRIKLEQGKKPPAHSSNSSQPLSPDYSRSLPSERGKRKHGPPRGHKKHVRQMVTNPDHVVEVKAKTCASCHTDLQGRAGDLWQVNQIAELQPAKIEVLSVTT